MTIPLYTAPEAAKDLLGTINDLINQVNALMTGSSSGGVTPSSDVPAEISALAGTYNLTKYYNLIGQSRSGAGGQVRVMVMGDSTAVMGIVGGQVNGWGAMLSNMLSTSATIPSAFDTVFVGAPAAYSEGRLVIGATSWSADTTKLSILKNTYKATTTTDALVFTPQYPTDICKVWYIQSPGAGSFTLTTTPASSTTTTNSDGADAVMSAIISTGSVLNWVYNVKQSAGGQVNIIGFEAYNSAKAGVQFMCGALGGTSMADWGLTTNAWSWLNAVIAMAPDVVIMTPGVNDMGIYTTAQYQTAMQNIVAALQAASISVVITTPIPQNPTDGVHNHSIAFQDSYVAINRSVAASYGCPVFDFYNLVGTYAAGHALTQNFYLDGWVHPSITGSSMLGQSAFTFLSLNTAAGRGLGGNMAIHTLDVDSYVMIRGAINLSRGGTSTVIVGQTNATDTAGINNTVVGDGAGALLSTGQNNTIVGKGAMAASLTAKLNNTAVGYECLKACTGGNNAAFGLQAGLIVTSGNNNTIIGQKVGSTILTTGSNNILIGCDNTVAVPLLSTSGYINIGNAIIGSHALGTAPGLAATGIDSQIGVLKAANFNSTADQTITVATPLGQKYLVTGVLVTNASTNLTLAAGGIYTAAAKGGTAVVPAAQVYTDCSTATGAQRATVAAAGLNQTFTGNLILSLTTGQGGAATADVYIFGRPIA